MLPDKNDTPRSTGLSTTRVTTVNFFGWGLTQALLDLVDPTSLMSMQWMLDMVADIGTCASPMSSGLDVDAFSDTQLPVGLSKASDDLFPNNTDVNPSITKATGSFQFDADVPCLKALDVGINAQVVYEILSEIVADELMSTSVKKS